jgi:putative ABC transport system substrate-binding protein
MNRRALCLAAIAIGLANAPLIRAQRPSRIHRVALVMGLSPEHEDSRRFLRAFIEGMKERGYQDGRNFDLAVRYYGRDRSRVAALADELVEWEADVLVANISSTAAVLRKKTGTIPIVMVNSIDAVSEGLVASLARPGGNVTGMTSFGALQHAKLVELARELLPRAKRVAFLVNPNHSLSGTYSEAAARSAKALGLEMIVLPVSSAADMERLGERLATARVDALVVATDALLFGLRDQVVRAALKARLPSVGILPEFTASGALASLGYDIAANYRGAAGYVDRILKGAKPADLPVEQPTKFELVVNLRTAKALGIAIPQSVLVRADRVIE